MRKKIKRVSALLMTVALGASLIGCSSTSDSTDDTDAADDANADDSSDDSGSDDEEELTYASIVLGESYTDITTTIKFIHHKTDRAEDGTMEALIAAFNEVYPNITVEMEAITDYAEDSLLRLSTQDWGDVMFIPAVSASEYSTYFIPYGTIEEMDEYINFADSYAYDGLCYGIGYMGNANGIVYNKQVFEDAGITELPTTPDEFIEALTLIKENTDAIPLYTNYAAGWTMGAWDAYLGIISLGDETWLNQKFAHTSDPFSDNGDGTGAYAVYKILYDAVAQGLIEDDFTTTDWETSKTMLNNGEIGCMILGSWSVIQMKEAGENADDIGYMPFPITVDGVQYASAGPDYAYAISATTSSDNQKAAMVFVKWMVEESGWCELEGGYPISKTAETSFDFTSATVLSDVAALDGEEDLLDDMNAESELSFNSGGNSKVQEIVEAAFNGTKTFDEIMEEWTEKWQSAQEELGVEVLY